MAIWYKNYSLSQVNERGRGTLVEHLGIEILEIGPDYLVGKMPVDHRTKQPAGLLHGGASVALAETLASTAGNLCVDQTTQICVGLEINANHIRACREGFVTGKAFPLHIGASTHVWQTEIHQSTPEGEKLVCVSRMTLSVLARKNERKGG